jgi:phage baseplate assembly protein V
VVDDLARAVGRLIGPLKRRVLLAIARGVVELVDDDKGLQTLQVSLLDDEVDDGVERFQQYGFSSHPIRGAELVTVCPGGDRAHAIVIAVDDRRYRLQGLAEGEVALYTDEGDSIVLGRNNTITVTSATKLRIDAPNVEMTGDLTVSGTIGSQTAVTDPQGTMDEMRAYYNSHKHGSSPTPLPQMT